MKKFNELITNIDTAVYENKLAEALSAEDPTSVWISDFVHSDDPRFKGKTKKQRIQMALGAAYAAKREKRNEDIDLDVLRNIAEEFGLELVEGYTDLELAESARLEALESMKDSRLNEYNYMMCLHHLHISEHYSILEKTELVEKHETLAEEYFDKLDSEYISLLMAEAAVSPDADYGGVPITMLPPGPMKNRTWKHYKAKSARGTTYDAIVDKEVRTSKPKTPGEINPKRRKEVEQEINRKALFGEEIDLQEAKTIDNPKVHDLRHLKSSRAVYDATQGGYRDKEGNDREVKDGDVIHTSKGVGILNLAWPVHHSGSEGAFHKLKPGYSMHTIDDGKYKKSVELANSVTSQNEEVVAEAINPDNPRDYNMPTYLRKRKGQAPLTMKDIKDRDTESPTTPEGLAKKAKRLGIDEGMMPTVSASIGGSMGSSSRAYAKAKMLAARAKRHGA